MMQAIAIIGQGLSSLCSYAHFVGEDSCIITMVTMSYQNPFLAGAELPIQYPIYLVSITSLHNLSPSLIMSGTFICTWPKKARKL